MSTVVYQKDRYIRDFFVLVFNPGLTYLPGEQCLHFDNLEVNLEFTFHEDRQTKIYNSANGTASAIPRVVPNRIKFKVRNHHWDTHAKVRQIIYMAGQRYRLCVRINPIIFGLKSPFFDFDQLYYVPGYYDAVIEWDKDVATLINGKGQGLQRDTITEFTLHATKTLTVPGTEREHIPCYSLKCYDTELAGPDFGDGTGPHSGGTDIEVVVATGTVKGGIASDPGDTIVMDPEVIGGDDSGLLGPPDVVVIDGDGDVKTERGETVVHTSLIKVLDVVSANQSKVSLKNAETPIERTTLKLNITGGNVKTYDRLAEHLIEFPDEESAE